MDAQHRYAELAAREAGLAEAELERSRGAWLYALSQDSQGMRDHFIRIASQARFSWRNHEEKARQFEERAERAAQTTRVESGLTRAVQLPQQELQSTTETQQM